MNDNTKNGRSKRVLIADQQPVFRLGIVTILASAYPDWDVTQSETLDEYRTSLRDGSFDLLIVGCQLLGEEAEKPLPIGGGMNAWIDIVAITEPGDAIGRIGCLAAGAHVTVSRSDPASRTLATIDILSMRHRKPAPAPDPEPPAIAQPSETKEVLPLTARQFEVLRLLATGQSNKVIARDLGLSVSTVKVHLNTVFRALGAHNRLEAVVRARPFQTQMPVPAAPAITSTPAQNRSDDRHPDREHG